ncbi:type IV secretory system conjugative DNA transfer family protein [Roseibium album]|uniref:Conjugal transfer coupling protein TraG n=1 Tax=Roseibium album TaxID=311410 RepID=A0A0M6ZW43_9HYPH|nr:TraM recognition domain-containing protein [Roseibium album]CTQ58147.1 conjugal transfer coupling protein TraG [Roseibium album]CTQ65683.1 conjugal transfer coupling protein TraG [Roseibium album]CTQ70564.1 conjugal transfer coupling protein TraG [Roseibium album]
MSWPFRRFTSNAGLDPEGHRLLGTTFKGEPIWAPKGHSLLLSANGGGKTTAGSMAWLYSLLSSVSRPAILVFDSKDGELCAQAAPMIAEMGIPVAAIDEMGVLGPDYPYRVTVNALGGVVSTYQRNPQDLVFTSENANQALISDPPDDQKNQYFRDQPRTLLEYIIYALLKRKQRLATLGAVWGLISNPVMLLKIAKIDAVEGDDLLKALAMDVLDMSTHEHWPAHRSAAFKALRIFSAGSRMFEAGLDPDATHADLIRKRAVIFLVGPQAFMNRLGAIYALHILAFTEALYKGAGPLTMIGDEFTNAPLKPLVETLTTLRAFGGEIHLIAQSRSEIERRFGWLETQTIEENAIVKQWFGFSSFEEAERVSKALGEGQYVSTNLSTDNKEIRLQSTYQTGKERLLTPAELMEMKPDEQLIHIKGLGFLHARKTSMEMIAPYCHLIRPNPLEGGILPPNPKIVLRTPKGAHS